MLEDILGSFDDSKVRSSPNYRTLLVGIIRGLTGNNGDSIVFAVGALMLGAVFSLMQKPWEDE